MIPPKNPIAITTAAIFPIIATNAGIVKTQVEIIAVCIPPDVAINTPPIASKRHTITNGLLNFNTTHKLPAPLLLLQMLKSL